MEFLQRWGRWLKSRYQYNDKTKEANTPKPTSVTQHKHIFKLER